MRRKQYWSYDCSCDFICWLKTSQFINLALPFRISDIRRQPASHHFCKHSARKLLGCVVVRALTRWRVSSSVQVVASVWQESRSFPTLPKFGSNNSQSSNPKVEAVVGLFFSYCRHSWSLGQNVVCDAKLSRIRFPTGTQLSVVDQTFTWVHNINVQSGNVLCAGINM